jgi:hypothetical protein
MTISLVAKTEIGKFQRFSGPRRWSGWLVEDYRTPPFIVLADFLETQELRRSPHGLKILFNSSSQKIAAKQIGAVEKDFMSGVELSASSIWELPVVTTG